MASNSCELEQTLKFDNCNSECNSTGAKKPIHNDVNNSTDIDYLRQEYHNSLDLNIVKPYPTLSEWQGFFRCLSQLRNNLDDKVEVKSLEESKRRCLAECKTNLDGQRTNSNFILAPPAPVVRLQDRSPNQSSASWRSCQQSSVFLGKRRFDTSDCIGTLGVPPFIVMGCTQCFLYVMVSEIEPKCPNCQSYLLDFFRGNGSKCSRMLQQPGLQGRTKRDLPFHQMQRRAKGQRNRVGKNSKFGWIALSVVVAIVACYP